MGGLIRRLGGLKRTLVLLFALLFGVLFGVAFFTFGYANGAAYFGHESETCIQCHSMNEEYEAFTKGSHKDVATCQSCHAPHDNFAKWLYSEADNGFWHSLKFTTGRYPENIKIREVNRKIVEDSCRHCHKDFVSDIESTRAGASHDQQISCLQCHSNVGHKR
ncbi:MAG: cytochrome c nitrite reductase small subunit [Micrococcales bacterium]|nr:cytochrome c nitrite reductase small subunit [Micrococcales bacterium]